MRRGDVYWAYLDPAVGSEQAGRRPVVIVSRDVIHNSTARAVIVPLTTRGSKQAVYSTQVEIKRGEAGIKVDSLALCEQVRSVSHERFRDFVGHLEVLSIARIDAALRIALDL